MKFSPCGNCGSTHNNKPVWVALCKHWCGHCGSRVFKLSTIKASK